MSELRSILKRHGAYPEQLYEELEAIIKSETDKARIDELQRLGGYKGSFGESSLGFDLEDRLAELQKPKDKDDK